MDTLDLNCIIVSTSNKIEKLRKINSRESRLNITHYERILYECEEVLYKKQLLNDEVEILKNLLNLKK